MGFLSNVASGAVRAAANAVKNAAPNAQISQAQADKQKATAAAVGKEAPAAAVGKAAQNVVKGAMGVGAGAIKAFGMKKGGSVTTRGQGVVMKKKRGTKKS